MSELIATTKVIVIAGMGMTGLSVARYLTRQSVTFCLVDSREHPPLLATFKQEFEHVNIQTGTFDEHTFAYASDIILSPGIALDHPFIKKAIEQGSNVIGDVELFALAVNAPVIAITGSNGKTTVTTLVAEMAKNANLNVKVGGNIGTPVLDVLDESADLYVLELSSFQLETTRSLTPTVATILNLSSDHMDRYRSMMEYHRAKQRIYFGAQHVVCNKQDPLTVPPLADGVQRTYFGMTQPDLKDFGLHEGTVLSYGLNHLISCDDLLIKGKHNVANALAALALGHAAGLSFPVMLKTLKVFKGLAHRCQYVDHKDGVHFVNDSKATNVGATIAAVEGFSASTKKLVVIAGGDSKGVDLKPLRNPLIRHAKALITLGKDGDKLGHLVDDKLPVLRAQTIEQAVGLALGHSVCGDTVLLSPACSSLDMFENYEARGKAFIDAVGGLQ